jgi:hypothetical protein
MILQKKAEDNGTTGAFAVGECMYQSGLTKREYFAGLAMQGLATKKPSDHEDDITRIVRTSVLLSDALLEELEKKNNEKL